MIEYKILIDLIHGDCRDTRAPCLFGVPFPLMFNFTKVKSIRYASGFLEKKNKLFDCRGIIDRYLLQIEREKKKSQ